jgi:hypothetical protein
LLSEAKTDGSGRFEFPLVEADKSKTFYVSCEVNGYARLESYLKVAAGQTLMAPPFVLLRLDQSVSGVVVDSDGSPLAGSQITVSARAGSPDANGWAQAGKDGRFTIARLPNVPLKLTAYVYPKPAAKGTKAPPPLTAIVDAKAGQTDVRIVLNTKAAGPKK